MKNKSNDPDLTEIVAKEIDIAKAIGNRINGWGRARKISGTLTHQDETRRILYVSQIVPRSVIENVTGIYVRGRHNLVSVKYAGS